MQRAAVIVAGGSGLRMGGDLPKQFLPLGGVPILVRTVQAFLNWDPDIRIALVLPEPHIPYWQPLAAEWLGASQARVQTCAGGAARTASVDAGLRLIRSQLSGPCLVAVHDGVRPFVDAELLRQAFEAAAEHGASVACVPVKATLRETLPGGLSRTVDRSRYLEVQTPQTFSLDALLDCFARRPHDQFSDDAGLYESFGHAVAVCPGSYDNIKITTPEDLAVGENILRRRA
ncbi:MAG: 2-C-methyl-D-erythritol 4-phosphate cytidylyltransferase [Bacteroidia bacterium]|nr:2-C-methyl-D-erythritol 4-phosphate cytidylyltransferase [Bacteroidia bacterium]